VNGKTDEQVSATHGVSTHTLNNWKKQLLATGNLDKKKTERKSGTPYKYKPEVIKEKLDKSKASTPAATTKDDKAQPVNTTKPPDSGKTDTVPKDPKTKFKKDKKKKKKF
jgi:transposase